MAAGPMLPDPCKCCRPLSYRDDDGHTRCMNCGRLTAELPSRRSWQHRGVAN